MVIKYPAESVSVDTLHKPIVTLDFCLTSYTTIHPLLYDKNGNFYAIKVKKPTADNRRMRFLTHDEAQRLLDEIRVHSVFKYQITLISLHCGLRFGEIAGLTWQDLNFQDDAIIIRNSKNGQSRGAFMTESVKAMFREMEAGKAGDFVFLNTGKNERMRQILDSFMKAVNKLGLNNSIDDSRLKVVFHSCRHSFASWLVVDGTDLFTVRELMGHKTLAMTARYPIYHRHAEKGC